MSARARRKEGINSDCCDQEPSSKDHAIYTADLATLGKVHATSHMTKVRSWRRAWWVPRLAFLNTLVALYIIWHHIRSLGLVESPPHAVKSTPATLRVTRFASGKLASPLAPGNWSRLTPVEPMPRQMADGQMNILVLVPDDGQEGTLPDCPSYRWVLVHEENVRDWAPFDLRRHLHRLVVVHRPVLILSLGESRMWIERGVGGMPYNFRRLWVHLKEGEPLTESTLTALLLESENPNRHPDRPLVSVATPTYRSGHKLQRAYQSLLNQTYDYWEWIIWDDSPDGGDTYAMLEAMALDDMRIQVFKAPQRSGIIGEMKFRAASLASGQWLVELDHDDRIAPQLFEWVCDIAAKHPGTKFIYSDHAELLEEDDGPFSYGENYGYNYGSYVRQHVRSHPDGPVRPHYISRSPWPNRHTLRHLVGLPNHVRIWNKAFYDAIGRHRGFLTVADDYDLMVRSFIAAGSGEWVCIAAPAYFQYRNVGGDNFTFKRNGLIQHLVQELYKWYYPQLLAKYDSLGWQEPLAWPQLGVWETELVDVEPRVERYFVPEDQDPGTPCISIVLPTYRGGQSLKEAVGAIVRQRYENWKLVIIGDGCPELDAMAEHDFPRLYSSHLSKIYWYNLRRHHNDGLVTARNYALRMIVKTEWVTYAGQSASWGAADHLERLISACMPANAEEGASVCVDGGRDRQFPGRPLSIMHRVALTKRYGYWKAAAQGSTATPEQDFLDRVAAGERVVVGAESMSDAMGE